MKQITFFFVFQLDVLFGNLTEMVEFQVEFLKTLEDGVRLVPDLEKLERVDQFKVSLPRSAELPRGPGGPSRGWALLWVPVPTGRLPGLQWGCA